MAKTPSKIRRLTNAEFKSIYDRVPRLCVEVCLLKGGGVALSKRAIEPERGKWHTPGGTVLAGETLAQAVRRIALAEMGVRVKIERLLGTIEYHVKGYKVQPVSLAYLVRPVGRRVVLRPDFQASEIRTFRRIPPRTVREQSRFLRRHFPFGAK